MWFMEKGNKTPQLPKLVSRSIRPLKGESRNLKVEEHFLFFKEH